MARTLSMMLAKTIRCLYSRSEGWWLDNSHVVGTYFIFRLGNER